MAKVSPTRMNLLARKSQLELAMEGVALLKQKREVLMREFMKRVKPLMEKQNRLHHEIVRAFHCLNIARAMDGLGGLQSAAYLREHRVGVEMSLEKNWGIRMPAIDSVEGLDVGSREPYAYSKSLRIFETRNRFEQSLELILEIAPLEAALKRLGREIQKTTRRINALEVMLVPRLRDEIREIRTTLEEREREDNFRLRRIKGKKESDRE